MMAPIIANRSTTATAAATLLAASAMFLLYKIKQRSKDMRNHETNRQMEFRDDESELEEEYDLPSHLEREAMKEKRRREKIKFLAMKKPMYDNVKILDPRGEHLANISRKKGTWYVNKNLGTWIDSETLRLDFEPKNRSNSGIEGLFSRSRKYNRCVACGDSDHHMRHSIVPFVYRTLLPLKFKSHLSHDIVILCPDCHLHCERATQLRMKDLHEAFGSNEPKVLKDREKYKVRSSALALLRWSDTIPEPERLRHEEIVCSYLNLCRSERPLTDELLKQAADVPYQTLNPKYRSGPELVIESIRNDEEKIGQFIRGWRRHFLDVARPMYLPVGWSVESSVTSDKGAR